MEGMNIESIKKELEDIWSSFVEDDVFTDDPLYYACSLSDFLDDHVPDLIEAGKYSEANEIVTGVYLKTDVWCGDESGCDDIAFVSRACLEYWRKMARSCAHPCKMEIMESLRKLSLMHKEFCDYSFELRELIADEFNDPESRRRRLEWADEDIAATPEDKWSRSTLAGLVNDKLELMREMGCPQEDITSVIRTYWHLREVREHLVWCLLAEGRKEDAVRVLTECREMDKANRYSEPHDTVRTSVAKETLKLADLYEELGRTEDYRSELLYFLFQMKLTSYSKQALLDVAERLKAVCTPEEWVEYRERMLKGDRLSDLRYDLMIREGLSGRVLEELLAKGNAHDMDRYEKYLKPLFPERLKQFYAEYIVREAPLVPAWKSYGYIMTCLKKITAYPGGAELAGEIAAQWRKTCSDRNLIHALDKAGF